MANIRKPSGMTAAVGQRTAKGTLITEDIARAVQADISANLIIQEDNAEQIANAMNEAIARALEMIGQAAERFAQFECPVDTGRLKNSITHALALDEDAVYVGTNVEYAIYVHEGVRGGKKHPFLRNAAANHGDYYRKICEDALENA